MEIIPNIEVVKINDGRGITLLPRMRDVDGALKQMQGFDTLSCVKKFVLDLCWWVHVHSFRANNICKLNMVSL